MLLRTQKELEVSGYPDIYDLEKLTKLHASGKQLPLVYSILSVDPPLASTASARMMWNGKLHSLLVMNTDSKYALRKHLGWIQMIREETENQFG